MTEWNPELTPNFSKTEMACKCRRCDSLCDMSHEFMMKLQAMRDTLGPMKITSGFRCPDHPVEREKSKPGSHAQGTAADISIRGGLDRYRTDRAAQGVGMVGFGVGENFFHVDDGHLHAARPAMWSY